MSSHVVDILIPNETKWVLYESCTVSYVAHIQFRPTLSSTKYFSSESNLRLISNIVCCLFGYIFKLLPPKHVSKVGRPADLCKVRMQCYLWMRGEH